MGQVHLLYHLTKLMTEGKGNFWLSDEVPGVEKICPQSHTLVINNNIFSWFFRKILMHIYTNTVYIYNNFLCVCVHMHWLTHTSLGFILCRGSQEWTLRVRNRELGKKKGKGLLRIFLISFLSSSLLLSTPCFPIKATKNSNAKWHLVQGIRVCDANEQDDLAI